MGDRAYGEYATVAGLQQRAVDVIARLHQRRTVDFRKARRLGKNDGLFTWKRGCQPSEIFTSPCQLYILCMDNDAETLLVQLKIPNVIPIRLAELEKEDKQLAEGKLLRSTVEYYFTSKASLMRYVLAQNPDCERVTYLDADLFFFSEPSKLDNEIAGSSVAVIEHRFSPGNQRLYKFGRFNAGWLSF